MREDEACRRRLELGDAMLMLLNQNTVPLFFFQQLRRNFELCPGNERQKGKMGKVGQKRENGVRTQARYGVHC